MHATAGWIFGQGHTPSTSFFIFSSLLRTRGGNIPLTVLPVRDHWLFFTYNPTLHCNLLVLVFFPRLLPPQPIPANLNWMACWHFNGEGVEERGEGGWGEGGSEAKNKIIKWSINFSFKPSSFVSKTDGILSICCFFSLLIMFLFRVHVRFLSFRTQCVRSNFLAATRLPRSCSLNIAAQRGMKTRFMTLQQPFPLPTHY